MTLIVSNCILLFQLLFNYFRPIICFVFFVVVTVSWCVYVCARVCMWARTYHDQIEWEQIQKQVFCWLSCATSVLLFSLLLLLLLLFVFDEKWSGYVMSATPASFASAPNSRLIELKKRERAHCCRWSLVHLVLFLLNLNAECMNENGVYNNNE